MELLELTEDQKTLIKKPLPKDAVKDHPTKRGMSTIKAIYVTERLNEVFGIGKWQIKTDLLPVLADGSLFFKNTYTTSQNKERTEYFAVAKTIFSVPSYGIYYECIAGASNDDMGDSAKGAATDAITKICSYLGIGIDVFKGQHEQATRDYENNQARAEQEENDRKVAELNEAIGKLDGCNSVDDLKKLKAQYPEYIVKHKNFVDAAKIRHTQITAPAQ